MKGNLIVILLSLLIMLIDPIRYWNIFYEYFIYKPGGPEEDDDMSNSTKNKISKFDCFLLVNLKKD